MTRRAPADLNIVASFYARWSPHEDKRREIADDHKEMFAEAKSEGLNPKALRKAFAEQYRVENQTSEQAEKRNETDEDVELYLSALARVREDEPEHDADGEVIEREVPVTVAAVGASPATLSAAAAQAANANVENDDVATSPAHAPEQPGYDHGSVRTPDEGGADSSEIHPSEAALLPQTAGSETAVASSQSVEGLSVPFTQGGSATSSAGTEGEADRQHIIEPQAGDGNARPVPVQTGGLISAPAASAGQVAVASPASHITDLTERVAA